ncbi:hypothetical protein V8C86DRAFT_2780828 [Haematococcus lacustris]
MRTSSRTAVLAASIVACLTFAAFLTQTEAQALPKTQQATGPLKNSATALRVNITAASAIQLTAQQFLPKGLGLARAVMAAANAPDKLIASARTVRDHLSFLNQVSQARDVLMKAGISAKSYTQQNALALVAAALANATSPTSFTTSATPTSSSQLPPPPPPRSFSAAAIAAAAAAPTFWDMRNPGLTGGSNYVCPVEDQGQCGSCQAFALAHAAEIAVAVARRTSCSLQLSPQWTFFCNGLYQPTCDIGWYPSQATDVLMRLGVPTASCYPYLGRPGCSTSCNRARAFNLPGRFSFQLFGSGATNIAAAKAWLRTNGPIMTYFEVFDDFMSYRGGIYRWNGFSRSQGGHAVVVVGYDDVNRCWIAKNSWGTSCEWCPC